MRRTNIHPNKMFVLNSQFTSVKRLMLLLSIYIATEPSSSLSWSENKVWFDVSSVFCSETFDFSSYSHSNGTSHPILPKAFVCVSVRTPRPHVWFGFCVYKREQEKTIEKFSAKILLFIGSKWEFNHQNRSKSLFLVPLPMGRKWNGHIAIILLYWSSMGKNRNWKKS